MHVDVEDIREAGDNALVMLHQRAKGKGSEVEVEIKAFGVYTFDESGVVRIQLFTEREPALAAAGLTPHYEEETR
jgi:hypothetical protein